MASAEKTLLICYSKEIIDGQPLYVSSNCLPMKALNLEPAGHAFHFAALRLSGYSEEENVEDDSKSESSNDKDRLHQKYDSQLPPESYSSSNKGKKKKSGSAAIKQEDYYALLGLSHLRYLATEDQIRKSYRETALKHHPDKQASLLLAEETESAKQTKKDEIENRFKAIQEAYEALIDPVRRRIYDSTDEFDDEIPTDCSPNDFFTVFGPAFLRNGRWSVNQPIPSLGDDKSSFKDIDKFYDFWYTFKSWREFPHDDECDLDQAESRDERRWMERQNAKLAEKARKEEYARIRALVDNAYKRDPRISRRKEEEKAEKKKKKEAKSLAKKLQEEEAVRALEEEKRRKQEEDKKAAEIASIQKKVREKEKKLLRKERSRFRTLLANVLSRKTIDNIKKDDVEELCLSLNIDHLKSLCDNIEGKEDHERVKILKVALGVEDDKKEETSPHQNGHERAKILENEIQGSGNQCFKDDKNEETSPHQNGHERAKILENAIRGSNQWIKDDKKEETSPHQKGHERSKILENAIGGGNQCLKDDKKGETTPHQNGSVNGNNGQIQSTINGTKKEKPWGKEEIELLRKGIQKYPKGTSSRWVVISEYIGSERSVEEILKATKTVLLQKPDSTKAFDSFLEKRKPSQPSIESPLSIRDDDPPKDKTSDLIIENGVKNNNNTCLDQETWSGVEERALIQALKTFSKETNQRWERVAAAVPGKNINQCKKKFLMMKDGFRGNKN